MARAREFAPSPAAPLRGHSVSRMWTVCPGRAIGRTGRRGAPLASALSGAGPRARRPETAPAEPA